MGDMMGHNMMGSGMAGALSAWTLFCALAGLAVLVALVAGGVWVLRRCDPLGHQFGGPPRLSADGPDPVQILKRRYAAGEIDDDEYERRLYELALH